MSAERAPRRLVVAISGASGSIYGIRLLEVLRDIAGIETHLIVSLAAKRTLLDETEYTVRDVEALATRVYDDRDIGAALASGSFRTLGMVVAPCSIKTLSALATSHADTLIARAGDVTLKEGRPLIAVVRETPLHAGHLRQMLLLAEMGGVILPPVPAFYHRPKTIRDLVDHTVGRVLDRLGIVHGLVPEWAGTRRPRAEPPGP
ncbi:MAG TPA: UbiX family flavin prenyltransferase [Methylomirabilota bacterium]|jgi:4-hydroxy-3-polyprenylbenzoate decarboxylase|nr:UbiX family flavin prenyltransferase [Methylomirabilota bacterium]